MFVRSSRRAALLAVAAGLLVLTSCMSESPRTQAPYDRTPDATSPATESTIGTSGDGAAEEAHKSKMNLRIGDRSFTATLVDNSSTDALRELLAEGPVTIRMSDFNSMEKVGELGTKLPTNDEQITTAPGDLILYQGDQFVIYYARNSWSLTRLGRIDGVDPTELRRVLGNGDVTVTLSID